MSRAIENLLGEILKEQKNIRKELKHIKEYQAGLVGNLIGNKLDQGQEKRKPKIDGAEYYE